MNLNSKIQQSKNPLIDSLIEKGKINGSLLRTQKRMLFANRIREELKAKNIKANKFAEMMGKSPSEISKWLNGTHNFTLDTITDIEAKLEITIVCAKEPGGEISLGIRKMTFHSRDAVQVDSGKTSTSLESGISDFVEVKQRARVS